MTTHQSPDSPWKDINDSFGRITGLPVVLTPYRENLWFQWQRMGWGESELKLVVAWIAAQNKKGGKYKTTFSRLIEDWPHFEEILGEARASSRGPRINAGRAATLRATGRADVAPSRDCASAATILEQTKLANDLRAWREKELQ